MSASDTRHVYDFGSPVWVEDPPGTKYPGVITARGGAKFPFVVWDMGPVLGIGQAWVSRKRLKPRGVEAKPTKWRFPEPGDVVRAPKPGYVWKAHEGIDLEVVSYWDIAGKIAVRGAGREMQYPICCVELVRLHDQPVETSTDHFADPGKMIEPTSDPVRHPSHYTSGGIECWDALKAIMGHEAYQGFIHGNAIKYLWRLGKKGPSIEDCRKAIAYLQRLEATLGEEPGCTGENS